jgi:hypothetical protein
MRLFAYAIFTGAVLFSLGEMGFLTEAADRFISFCLVLTFIAMHITWDFRRLRTRNLLAGIGLLVAAAVLARGGEVSRLLAFTLIPAAVCAAMPDDDTRKKDVALLIPAVVFFLISYLTIRHVAHVWWLADHAAMAFSRVTGRLVGQAYAFGATASGLRVMLFIACWGLARFIWAERRRPLDFALYLLMLVAVTAAVEMLLTALAIAIQRWLGYLVFLLFNSQVLYLFAALGPVAWYRRRTAGMKLDVTAALRPRLLPVALLAGISIGLGLTLMPFPGPGHGKVLIVDEGLLNWRLPVFGSYGERSGGMFGRLPGFLDAQGYESGRVSRPITAGSLEGARALVVINLMESFSTGEKAAIWDFVRRGGALLALGDHTGVAGIRKPFNDLLGPVSIEFEFDSATFWAQGWRDQLELMPHPINRGVIDAEDIQIWVGASLVIRPPAMPVIVGKYGYSDIGDESNVEMSYLGDRRHNPGEKIGDLVLVAEARYGAGRVLVFGDTSPFQNGALVSSWAFAQRVFLWLTGSPRHVPLWVNLTLAAAGIALLLLVSKSPGSSAYAYIAVAAGIAIAAAVTGRLSNLPPPPRIDVPKAIVDFSHGERFDQLTWYDDCVGGLEFNLMRNGYSAHIMREFSERFVLESQVLVVIAPSIPFSRREIETIDEFMETGGLLILSTGYEEKDRSEELLSGFGASIENVPLAHFEVEIFGQTVRFAEAWPIEIADPEAVALAHHPDYILPVMAFIPRGEGGALLIGDSQFLLNSNLESLKEWHEGNIMFLREVLTRHRSGDLGI